MFSYPAQFIVSLKEYVKFPDRHINEEQQKVSNAQSLTYWMEFPQSLSKPLSPGEKSK